MPTESDMESTPLKAIRRFDAFAEFSRQERREQGAPEDEAKGYGIWLAKGVAARRFGRKGDGAERDRPRLRGEGADRAPRFRSVGDELHADATFDHDIVERMGATFYEEDFVPATADARAQGVTCEDIRDSIRKGWKPTGATAWRRAPGQRVASIR